KTGPLRTVPRPGTAAAVSHRTDSADRQHALPDASAGIFVRHDLRLALWRADWTDSAAAALSSLLDAAHLPNRPCHGAGAVHLRTGQRTSLPAFTAQRQKYLPQPDRRDGFRPYHLGDCTLYLCRSVLQRV